MEGRNREVEKTATVACNGSFLSGVVQVGRKQRGKGGGGRSVGWFSVHAPTTQHPRQQGATRIFFTSIAVLCRGCRSQVAHPARLCARFAYFLSRIQESLSMDGHLTPSSRISQRIINYFRRIASKSIDLKKRGKA